MDFNNLSDMELDLLRAFNVAKIVSFHSEEYLTDKIFNLWNQDKPTEEETITHRVAIIETFGLDEVTNRLELRGEKVSPEMVTYYKLIK